MSTQVRPAPPQAAVRAPMSVRLLPSRARKTILTGRGSFFMQYSVWRARPPDLSLPHCRFPVSHACAGEEHQARPPVAPLQRLHGASEADLTGRTSRRSRSSTSIAGEEGEATRRC